VTIAATYLTSEGVVLGADSTATISSPAGVVQLLDHAQRFLKSVKTVGLVFAAGALPGMGRSVIGLWQLG
jgi:hypothetical protein